MYKNIGKILNFISIISSIVMIISISIYNGIANGTIFNSYSIIIFLCMFINPVLNLYRLKNKVIYNPIYHFVLILFSVYVSSFTIFNIFNIFNSGSSLKNNIMSYFSNYILYFICCLIFIILFSFIFKKDVSTKEKDYSKLMFFAIGLSSFFLILNYELGLNDVLSLCVSIFSFIMIFKLDEINTVYSLQNVYFVLFLLCIFSSNVIGIILLIHMYLQLTKFGLNV